MSATYRRAARIVVTDPDERVLMFLVEPRPGFSVWITPGGGLEDGESFEDAGTRELREEVGLEGVKLGPPIWTRRHTFTWREKLIDADERFFWVPDVHPDVRPPPSTEFEPWTEVRWWTIEEIRASDPHIARHAGGEPGHPFAPRRLADLLEQLFRQGRPAEPIDTGV